MDRPTNIFLEVLEDAIRDELRAYGIRGYSLISTPHTGSIRLSHDNGRTVYVECGDWASRDPSKKWTLKLECAHYNSYERRWNKDSHFTTVLNFDLGGVDLIAMLDIIVHHLAEIDRESIPALMPHDEPKLVTGFKTYRDYD